MQNLSSIGYQSFASQFNHQQKQNQSLQQKILTVKKNKVALLHSLCIADKNLLFQTNQSQLTLLHFSAFYNSYTVALYLLCQDLNPNSKDKQGKTAFHLSSYTGHVQVFKIIIQYWKLQKIKTLNDNFIQILVKMGFKRMDSKQGKLKQQVSKQRMAKFLKGQQQIQRLYTQYRKQYTSFIIQSLSLSDIQSNRNCFHLLALNKYQKCLITLQYVLKCLHNQDLSLDGDFFMALVDINKLVNIDDPRQYEDCLAIIKEFIIPDTLKHVQKQQQLTIKESIYKILEEKDKAGHTPFYLASKAGAVSIVSLLKKTSIKYAPQQKQNPLNTHEMVIKIASNNSARNQITDLCEASKKADVQIMNFLISCGQQINKKKSIFGTFAILQSVKAFEKQKNIQPIKVLMKSGADVNQQDSNGWTIFHHIAEKGHIQILKQILKQKDQKRISKLKLNKTTNKGYHMLHIAAMNNKKDIIELMMNPDNAKKYQIDLNPLDQQKASILHHAAKKGSLQTLTSILSLNPNLLLSCDINSNTCLHLAASSNHIECIRSLILFDSDNDLLLQMRNKKGKLPKDLTLKKKSFQSIFSAARQGDVNMIRNLINQNKNLIDTTTKKMNRTPLILAVMQMQLVCVKFLVEQGADQYHEDKEGKTAQQHCDQLKKLYQKNDKTKLLLINKIRSLLD